MNAMKVLRCGRFCKALFTFAIRKEVVSNLCAIMILACFAIFIAQYNLSIENEGFFSLEQALQEDCNAWQCFGAGYE